MFTPDDVVELAADPTHLFHEEFTWDDRVCGVKWRRDEARRLVRAIVVSYSDATGKTLHTAPAWVSVEVVEDDEDGVAHESRRYMRVERALADPDTRGQVLARAKQEAAFFRKKYRVFSELSPIFTAMDEVFGA